MRFGRNLLILKKLRRRGSNFVRCFHLFVRAIFVMSMKNELNKTHDVH